MTDSFGSHRVTLDAPNGILFAFLPRGMSVAEFRCEVKSDADLEAIQRVNAPRLGCTTGAIVEVERDGRRFRELRLSQTDGPVTVFWRSL